MVGETGSLAEPPPHLLHRAVPGGTAPFLRGLLQLPASKAQYWCVLLLTGSYAELDFALQ